MPSIVVNLMIIIATIVLALAIFEVYSVYMSSYALTFLQQENVIGLSKLVSASISQVSFYGIPPSYNYFNVSYIIWIKSPTPKVTIIPFVISPQLNPFYALPNGNQNATLFYSTTNGYNLITRFQFNNNVYLPQQGQLLGKVNSYAFNITSNQTYIISAKVRLGQIIIIWILDYFNGKWYRLDYTYLNPTNCGIGVYALSSSGLYDTNSPTLTGFPQPHISISQTGFQIGLWFSPISNATTQSIILNATLGPTGSQGNSGKIFSIVIYQLGYNLYLSIMQSSITTFHTLLYSLSQNTFYFLNFTSGSQANLANELNISIYSYSGKILNYTKKPLLLPSEINGYTLNVTFGSPSLTDVITQAFFETLKNQGNLGSTSFYNASTVMLKDGYLYNNTYNYTWIIAHSKSLYAIGYWYFVYQSSNPPSQIYGLLWVSGKTTPYYIPEIGKNTYVIL
ncbi:hypothetical protein [Saccharolobus caldissimus]|uniref:Uncharacterized protein n=1 Tax=Saccharolobus caldissimus TaxID=1702097 RepID=A0AAQ4CTJ2_9CREN|nr:hypothetical protein [Saccharolobus caldissimus]BDB99123.1 hypothetical protein SACC_21400 [Saccharolobus caldissimus]